MGVSGASSLGIGIGVATALPAASWSRGRALLDADFTGDRYLLAGRNLPGKAAFLLAVGGTEAVDGISIGPYAIPGAPEKLANGDFSGGAANWNGFSGGTITVSGGVCSLQGNGGNSPGFVQAVPLVKGHAYQFRGRLRKSDTLTPAWTVSSSATLGGTNACHLPSNVALMSEVASTFSADQATMYAGGRVVSNPANSGAEFDDASVLEVLPFEGFVQEGFAAVVSGTMPSAAGASDKVIFEASCGGTDNFAGHERNRVRLAWDAAKHLRLVITARNVEQANLDLGMVEVLAGFDVLFSVQANLFRAALGDGPVLADTSGDLPGIGRMYLKRQNATGSTFDGGLDRLTLFSSPWSEAEFLHRQATLS
jgi:hypothetical protein